MNKRLIINLLLAAGLIYAAAIFAIFPKWTVDDAFITFRYADNFANHGQLTWNVGEKPIEGYTGIALPALLAGFVKLGFSPITASHAVGIFFYFFGWLMFFLSLKALGCDRLVGSIFLLFYSTMPIFFTHALSGMETMMFLGFIWLSFFALLNSFDILFFASLLLAGLARPEGAALALALVLPFGYFKFKSSREGFKIWIWKFAVFYFLPALVYFIWRINYYGALLPNTFYAKSSGFSLNNLIDISRFLRRYFDAPVLAALIMLAPAADGFFKEGKFKLRQNALAAFWGGIIFMGLVVLALFRTHLLTNFSTRFYTPLLPALWLIAAYISSEAIFYLKNFREERPLGYKLIWVLFFALSFYQIGFQISKIKDEMAFARQQIAIHENEHNALGRELKNIVPSSEWLVVYWDAGAIPYFSGLRTIDFGGLNDPTLARKNLPQAERIDYFFSKTPGAIVFTSLDKEKVAYTAESDLIASDARFKNYVLYKKYLSPLPDLNYNQFVYLRKDIYAKLAH